MNDRSNVGRYGININTALIGAGGHSHDILGLIGKVPRFVDKKYWVPNDELIYTIQRAFNPEQYKVIVSIANPIDRQEMVERLPTETKYFTYIHPSVVIASGVKIGTGCAISPGATIMGGSVIGNHSIINLNTVIGHDCKIGDYFTIAPLAGVMGNCVIGDRVEIGAGAQVKPGTSICDDVTIGMCAGVLHDIDEAGTYIGVPAKRYEHRFKWPVELKVELKKEK